MAKLMSYCSLEEAWGEEYANLYKKNDSMVPAMPPSAPAVPRAFLNDRQLTEISCKVENRGKMTIDDYYLKNKMENPMKPSANPIVENFGSEIGADIGAGNSQHRKTCSDFLDHFMSCPICQKKLANTIGGMGNGNGNGNGNAKENYMDIFIIILTGIFVIFVLDSLFRLGKSFRH